MQSKPEPAPFLTILEAAELLGVSRTTAYELARRYLATDGREGLPVVRLGKRLLRCPRRDFEARFRCSKPVDPDNDGSD